MANLSQPAGILLRFTVGTALRNFDSDGKNKTSLARKRRRRLSRHSNSLSLACYPCVQLSKCLPLIRPDEHRASLYVGLGFHGVPLIVRFFGFRSDFFVKLLNAYLDSRLHIGLRFHSLLLPSLIGFSLFFVVRHQLDMILIPAFTFVLVFMASSFRF